MFEFILLAQLVFPEEMDKPKALECAAEIGVDPSSRDFTYTEFQRFVECRGYTINSLYDDV